VSTLVVIIISSKYSPVLSRTGDPPHPASAGTNNAIAHDDDRLMAFMSIPFELEIVFRSLL
jgi:hypothetical protein